MKHIFIQEELDFSLLPADPMIWIEAFKDKEGTIFFDSALRQEELGRWSFVAIDPLQIIRSKAGRTWVGAGEVAGDPFIILRDLLAPYEIEDNPELPPFIGGIAGYFGYDLRRHVEEVPEHRVDNPAMPDLMAGLYDLVLAIDHERSRAFLFSRGRDVAAAKARIAWCKERLMQFAQTKREAHSVNPSLVATPDLERIEVERMVRRTLDYIEAGDIYQANITHRFSVNLPDGFDKFLLYRDLRERNPATFGAYVDFGEIAILSSSPERFLRSRFENVEARPIKGTNPRSLDKDEDKALARQLLSSEKDRAENLMIVDLLRNDLSRVCEIGSVKVPVLCGLESYATVHHLVSVVTGKLRQEKKALDLLRSAFPGGSVTGAPKIRAMEIIAELEPTWRGPYCGSIGYISATGAMDTNIVIRSYCIMKDRLAFQVGGGIVADSTPSAEYEESLVKAKALIDVLANPKGRRA